MSRHADTDRTNACVLKWSGNSGQGRLFAPDIVIDEGADLSCDKKDDGLQLWTLVFIFDVVDLDPRFSRIGNHQTLGEHVALIMEALTDGNDDELMDASVDDLWNGETSSSMFSVIVGIITVTSFPVYFGLGDIGLQLYMKFP